jgi:hypothetical protein
MLSTPRFSAAKPKKARTVLSSLASASRGPHRRHRGAAGGNRKGYAGYEFDSVAAYSLWHVRHRVLNSDLGRWTRRDPITAELLRSSTHVRLSQSRGADWWMRLAFDDGTNLFQYTSSCPVGVTDSTGLAVWIPYPLDIPWDLPSPQMCYCCLPGWFGCGAWSCGTPLWVGFESDPLGFCVCEAFYCVRCFRSSCPFGCTTVTWNCSGACYWLGFIGIGGNCTCPAVAPPCNFTPGWTPRLPALPPCFM